MQGYYKVYNCHIIDYAKFCASLAITGLVVLLSLCHRVFEGFALVQIIFLWVFCRSKIFSPRYFVGLKLFIVGILLIKDFTFLVGISQTRNLFSWVISEVSVVGRMIKGCHKKYILNCVFFANLISTIVNSIYVGKVLHLQSYL